VPPNHGMQPTWQHVTRLARGRARRAPCCHADSSSFSRLSVLRSTDLPAEFEVIEFTGEFYTLAQTREAFPTGNRWKGWLRLVTGDGLPEFWFFTRD